MMTELFLNQMRFFSKMSLDNLSVDKFQELFCKLSFSIWLLAHHFLSEI